VIKLSPESHSYIRRIVRTCIDHIEPTDYHAGQFSPPVEVLEDAIEEITQLRASRHPRDHLSDEIRSAEKERILAELITHFGASVGEGEETTVVLGDERATPWVATSHNKWLLSEAHKKWLRESEGRSEGIVTKTYEAVDIILDSCGDPRGDKTAWFRRGLVIGNVQMGKTQHFLSLVNKALDAGFFNIVVLGGHTNDLRKQTQLRLEEAVIGKSTSLNKHQDRYGVALHDKEEVAGERLRPVAATTVDQDFSERTLNVQLGLYHRNDKKIFVVKKNARVLEALAKYFEKEDPSKPILLIDDEADYASVNTGYAKGTYSKINSLIKAILDKSNKKAYIGYTATPFANIFMPYSLTISGDTRDDLFPEDFIVQLFKPSAYQGQDVFFGKEDDETDTHDGGSLRPITHIVDIDDNSGWLPLKHKKDFPVSGLHPQLQEAGYRFLINCGIRQLREGQEASVHNTMLVNVSRFQSIQAKVGEILKDEFLRKVTSELTSRGQQYLDGTIDKRFCPHILKLEDVFSRFYEGCEVEFSDCLLELITHSGRFRVEVVNHEQAKLLAKSSREELLDYENSSDGLWVIAVGGLKLSRGLTLEGLSVSFFLRKSQAYDTLTQMCRWFGYRPRYEDICHLYLTQESDDHYRFIAEAIDELRTQIDAMRLRDLRPVDFGLRVRNSDAALLVTAKNKQGAAESVTEQVSIIGEVIRRLEPPRDKESAARNFAVVKELAQSERFEPFSSFSNSLIAKNVSPHKVLELLERLEMPDRTIRNAKPLEAVRNTLRKFAKHEFPSPHIVLFSRSGDPSKVTLSKSVRGNGGLSETIKCRVGDILEGAEPFFSIGQHRINPIVKAYELRSDLEHLYLPKNSISDKDDLKLLLEIEGIDPSDVGSITNASVREHLKRPILMLYPVIPASWVTENDSSAIGRTSLTLPLGPKPTVGFILYMPTARTLAQGGADQATLASLTEQVSYTVNEVYRNFSEDDATDEEPFDEDD